MQKHEHEHLYEGVKITTLPKSEVEITGSIPVAKYAPLRARALTGLLQNLDMPGFRKGHVPESTFISRYGEQPILEEIADMALRESYSHLIHEHNLSPLGSPQIGITKLAKDNPIEFKITIAIYPTVNLAAYKEIAKEENAKPEVATVTEKDIADTILNIRKSRVPADATISKDEADNEENLPAYNDAFVQTLGDFTDIKDFEMKLREGIKVEKERAAREKKRIALLERLTQESDTEVPSVLIESELAKMTAQFESDITRMGGTLETYLTHIKKSKEDLHRDWRGDAEKRAKLELVLREIADKEKIVPKIEDIDREVQHLEKHHTDADPTRLRAYVAAMIEKEEVVKFLESQK